MIINQYNKKGKNFKDLEFGDDAFLIIKFKDFEEKFIATIKSQNTGKDSQDVETKEQNIYLEKVKNNLDSVQVKEKNMIREKNTVNRSIDSIKLRGQKDEEMNKYLGYIIEIGDEIEGMKEGLSKKKREYEFPYYTSHTLNALKKKERIINQYIEEIEALENSENNKLISEIITDVKNQNKKDKLRSLKLKQEEKENERNRKAMERNSRLVVKGRPVPKEFPFGKIKDNKVTNDDNSKDDYELLFFG